MQSNLSYNIHEAINLRGLTFDQAGLFDIQYMEPKVRDETIDFRTSCSIANNDNQWGNIPYHREVLMGSSATNKNWSTLTRKQWDKLHRDHRIYLSQCYPPAIPL